MRPFAISLKCPACGKLVRYRSIAAHMRRHGLKFIDSFAWPEQGRAASRCDSLNWNDPLPLPKHEQAKRRESLRENTEVI